MLLEIIITHDDSMYTYCRYPAPVSTVVMFKEVVIILCILSSKPFYCDVIILYCYLITIDMSMSLCIE